MTERYMRTCVKHSAWSNLYLVYSSAWKSVSWEEVSWPQMPRVNGEAQYTTKSPWSMFEKVPMQTDTKWQTKRLVSLSPEDAGKEVINYLPVSHKVLRSLLSLNMLYYLTSNIWHMVMRWVTLVLKVIVTQMSRSEMGKLVNAFIC